MKITRRTYFRRRAQARHADQIQFALVSSQLSATNQPQEINQDQNGLKIKFLGVLLAFYQWFWYLFP